MSDTDSGFEFEISLSVLNHLGRNLYRNFITVLGEAISNSWDADAKNVWIDIDKENSVFSIKDDGDGMTANDFQSKFLKIGYSKRKKGVTKTAKRKRPFIGAKGIGKLALLSCAQRVSVFTKTEKTDYVGGLIDNSELDVAIKDDLKTSEYPLENLDFDLIDGLSEGHNKGTIIVFDQTKEILRNSESHIKKLLAMSFKFSLLDKDFNMFVNGKQVTIDDLKDLSEKTEFLWLINEYDDEYVQALTNLKADTKTYTTSLDLKGFIATVKLPSHLKIRGTEERATIDLFVNGRLREKNVIRHTPTQRIAESYMYGQIHFDFLDQTGDDPFTSSREGIIENDENFQALLIFLKEILFKIFDEWDELRLARGEDGDDEEPRKSKKQRRARSLYSAAREEFKPDHDAPEKEEVESWLKALQQDAEYNLFSYADCFLAENLVRKYIGNHGIVMPKRAQNEAKEWRGQEEKSKEKAGISYDIRRDSEDLSYMGMDTLVKWAEAKTPAGKKASLINDAITFKPVRNAVGHTGLLTDAAKNQLSATLANMKARVVALVSGK